MDRRLFFLLHRAPRALLAHANSRSFEALGVSSAQLAILHYVKSHDGCSLTAVADMLDINKSAVSGIVQRMERGGLVRREANPNDGRGSRLFLTGRGASVRAAALPLIRKLTAEITAGFSAGEVETILRFLNSIVDRYATDEPQ